VGGGNPHQRDDNARKKSLPLGRKNARRGVEAGEEMRAGGQTRAGGAYQTLTNYKGGRKPQCCSGKEVFHANYRM